MERGIKKEKINSLRILFLLFFIIFSDYLYSQNKINCEVLAIDSTILTYYYVIDARQEGENCYYTILTEKIQPCICKGNLPIEIIQIGKYYYFTLQPMNSLLERWDGMDSVYLNTFFLGDIIISGRVFFSKDNKRFPYKTIDLYGLGYVRTKD